MPESASALVAEIKRLTLHDGPGLRTTVFLKGCPLQCRWCHNPELISGAPRLLFHESLCSLCKECVRVCPAGVHSFAGCQHDIAREHCTVCGKCVEGCLQGALTVCGVEQTAEKVYETVRQDELFYRTSGGGVTVSGGEPLLCPEFVERLFTLAKRDGVSTALDTCGHVPFAAFSKVLPVTDLILYDLKGMDAALHKANTGSDNRLILENLARLGHTAVPLEIRMPVVPGLNDAEGEFGQAGAFLAKLPNLAKVKLLAYHSLAHGKYRAADIPDTMPDAEPPSPRQMEKLRGILRQYLSIEIALPE